MWHAKQQNIVLPGQRASTPKRFQEACIGKMIHPPPSVNYDNNFTGGSSRKRKSRDMDPPGATPEYRFPWESKPRDIGSALESNGQGNYVGVHFNQTESAEPGNLRQQFKNDQVHLRNDFLETWLISSTNFRRTGIDRISNDSLSLPPQYLQPKGPLLLRNSSVRETPMVPNGQTQASYAGHSEDQRFLPFPKSGNRSSEKAHIAAHLHDLTGSEVNKSVFGDKLLQEMCNTMSEQLRPVENLHQHFFQPNMYSDGLKRRTFSREDKFESVQLNQSGNCSNDAATGEPLNAETSSLGASVYGDKRSLEHDVQINRAPLGNRFNYASQNKERIHGDGNMKIKETTTASDSEKLKYSVSEDIPSKNVGEIVGNDQKNDESHSFPISEEKSSLPSGTAASTVAEKLWDGYLQLSSSVTLSAVAFFRRSLRLYLSIFFPILL
ncbi:hypothetical protein RJ639_032043 [Escallonia herrerae]|uniref:Uncharacterized protein n=1 Tax=Escallonia herrerae TaxID=1293975 RepID=A0AA88X2M9_9ASTE|nr:hypothetical protein RJ639_032043 [Escallonia herrerae]